MMLTLQGRLDPTSVCEDELRDVSNVTKTHTSATICNCGRGLTAAVSVP
jgi:hypothetical protein